MESYRKLRRLLRHSKLDSHAQTRQNIHVMVSRADNSIGKLTRQCRQSSTEPVIMITSCYSIVAVCRRLDSTEGRLQIQPQQTTGSHSRLQVAKVDCKVDCMQPKQTAGSHSRLQVAIVDYRQPQQAAYRQPNQTTGIHSRDNYVFGMPDKMSGQINVSPTLSSHRYFLIYVKSNHIATCSH